ncbi:EAL domain-containing protein [Aliikangiella marina]|uniref:cyclic-guanylate-specific phosphodiesterase n=1 Tax=Aliikangiella marina TaxID=1712262 RepID=A0A545TD82_9GAMM|nr:EAL domain-containing protein [Aliikangiella marina]TQV75184.1 EAL domain-containing protein [Aliikangiella marina]
MLIRRIFILILVLNLPLVAKAEFLKVKRLNDNPTIPSNYILDIDQLDSGYMLVSTDAGARLYDGYRYIPITKNSLNPDSPLNSRIYQSLQDSNGNLWFATDRGLFVLYHNQTDLKKISHNPQDTNSITNNNVRAILEDSRGDLWFGTLKGVSRLNPKTNQFKHYLNVNNKSQSKDYFGRIFKLIEENNYIWVGSTQGLFSINLTNDELKRATGKVGTAYITSATYIDDETLWFGSDINGIFEFNLKTREFKNYRKESWSRFELMSNNVWSLRKASNDVVWVGYWNQGASAFDLNTDKSFRIGSQSHNINSLPANSIEQVYEDDSGLIWIATNGGLAVFDQATFAISSLQHDPDAKNTINDSHVVYFLRQNDETTWLGSIGGLQKWNTKTDQIEQLTHLTISSTQKPLGSVWQVHMIDENNLLLATDRGMVRYNLQSEEIVHFSELKTRNDKALNVAFYAVTEDSDGWYFVASSASTIHRLNPTTGQSELIFDSSDSEETVEMEYITKLLLANDRSLWVGSTTGVYQLDPTYQLINKLNVNDSQFKLSGNLVYDLFEDNDGRIWVATSTGGINQIEYQGHQIVNVSYLNKNDGLPSNQIFNLIPYDDNSLWFSTQSQVGKFDLKTQTITNYSVIGGYDRIFVEGSTLVDPLGNIYIGGSEVIKFHPKDMVATEFNPKIKFSGVSRLHQTDNNFNPLQPKLKFEVQPEDSLVTFHFTSLDFADTVSNRYRYQLEGYDKNWLTPGNEPKASFTQLPPGQYLLKVQGTNRDGVWSDQTATMTVVVHPPLWRTWYAYLIYFLIVAGVIAQHYARKRKARQLELSALLSIKESEAKLKDVLWGSGDVLWRWDLRTNLITTTDNAGMKKDTHEEKSSFEEFLKTINPNDQAIVQDMIDRHLKGEQGYYEAQFRVLDDASQDWQWVMSRGRIVERDNDGNPVVLAGTRKNIEDLKKTEKQLRFLANYDQLTRLPNRALFQEHLLHAIAIAERFEEKLAVLFFDLDGFKDVNDSLGHAVGDQLLQRVALRLTRILRTTDSCARLGGDEFAVIIERLKDKDETLPTLNRLLEDISRPYALSDQTVTTSISVGVSIYPEHGKDPANLLKHADIAMYEAKRAGKKTYRFYDREMNALLVKRLELSNELKSAIVHDQFETHFQPRVSVETNQVAGFEALIRWRHPERGLISPAEFIPVAEDTGQILELGDWILRDACKQAAQWYIRGWRGFISINIAALQFQQVDLVSSVENALNLSDLPPECLELEITEGTLIKDINRTKNIILRLKRIGIKIALDDFGTGYSSLSYLQQLPIDSLKIDRSFINQIPGSSKSARLCKAIINMAHSLNLQVIAEGIEQQPQLDFLKEANCEEYQGYLFGKPVPASEIDL